jgi:hypothetical protein
LPTGFALALGLGQQPDRFRELLLLVVRLSRRVRRVTSASRRPSPGWLAVVDLALCERLAPQTGSAADSERATQERLFEPS